MKIFVIIFWLRAIHGGDAFEIDSLEFGGEAKTPALCAELPMDEVLKPVKDAAEKIADGLQPVVVCGVPAPQQDDSDESGEKPPIQSSPRHPDQPQGPSGSI